MPPCSLCTFSKSTSSSSAISIASALCAPWPISTWPQKKVTLPSAPILSKELSLVGTEAASVRRAVPGRQKLMIKPPPAAALALRKVLRPKSTALFMSQPLSHHRRRGDDGLADAVVGAAATDVTRHRFVNVGVRRVLVLGEQRCR